MAPHSGVGAGTPRPRKLKPVAVIMVVATLMVACTMIGARQFGKIYLKMMRASLAPVAYEIVRRVHETAENYGVTMTQVALAWQLAKGMTAPIVGATKAKYLEDAARALELSLSKEDIAYLEEPYQPHRVVGLRTDDDEET